MIPVHSPLATGWRAEVAALIFEFVEQTIAFGFADFLDNHLLGGLRGDPSQLGGIHLDAILGRVDGTGIGVRVLKCDEMSFPFFGVLRSGG